MELTNHSRVAVVGGGPAGSLTAYFMLDIAQRLGMHLNVEIYNAATFSAPGPKGCNHCGGIISETLVQMLAMEGINLPPSVVQRGIDSYALHTEQGSVSIVTPLEEMRIAALYRGSGPLNCLKCAPTDASDRIPYQSFDALLLERARQRGARVHPHRVTRISQQDGLPNVSAKGMEDRKFDLVVGTMGVNGGGLRVFDRTLYEFRPPKTTRAFITEIHLGRQAVNQYFGNTMHVFLMRIPRVDFSALIPKGEYVTLALLGRTLDKETALAFLAHPQVKACFPPDADLNLNACQCHPDVCLGMARPVFFDRVALVGDAAVSRLYKDGIGAAYKTAKALAITAVIHGISKEAFARHYLPTCRRLNRDNWIGSVVFLTVNLFKWVSPLRQGMLRMVRCEQGQNDTDLSMSLVLWDTFTGSNTYQSIFMRSIQPFFLLKLLIHSLFSVANRPQRKARPFLRREDKPSKKYLSSQNQIGKRYQDGEVVVRVGDAGDCMFLIQKGELDILIDETLSINTLTSGDFFGEMSLLTGEKRSATVKSRGESWVLTIDESAFQLRLREDPVLGLRILETMYQRLTALNQQGVGYEGYLAEPQSGKHLFEKGQKWNLFSGMRERHRKNALDFRDYRTGQVIIPQGCQSQALGFIVKGKVEVYHKTLDGDDTVVHVLSANDIFGIHSLFCGIPRPTGIRSKGESKIALMDMREYLSYTHDNTQMAFRIQEFGYN